MKIERLVFKTENEAETVMREKILTVPIQPGIATGTQITFPEEGDQGPSKIPADIIFVTEDRPHETFKRECANLSVTVRIFLREALIGTVVPVKTIDERILRIPVTSIVTPEYEKIVPGEGLPLPLNPEQRGDLVIRFDIEFPIYMPMTSKSYLKKAFRTAKIHDGDDFLRGEQAQGNIDDDIPLRRDRHEESGDRK
ncbi:dnaJ homolog subfamily B member 13-like [Venturia canescens]|uniref:dnaJ homolog subfamily B member 13-like n=1 Tax=Venturia canescens TaxID=32260 RepID=UPI001C9CF06E|nr:dnaJ homolog subfamily B member 13-like [Venturia canescens]